MSNLKKWVLLHKKISIVLGLIVVFAGYKIFFSSSGAQNQTKYVIASVQKGTIVSTVTGTGQVSASNRVDVTSEVSGDVISVPVKLGDNVTEGQALAYIDSLDAQRAVQNAQLSLDNAKIAYEKAQKTAGDQATDSTVSDLNQAYDDGYTAISNTFIALPDIIDGMNSIFYDQTHSPYFTDLNAKFYAGQTAVDYKYQAGITFDQSKKDYDVVFKLYKSLNQSDRAALTNLISSTLDMNKELYSALTGAYNTIDYIKSRISDTVPSEILTDKSSISTYITKVNNNITALSNALTDIENAKDSTAQATLDLKSAELKVNEAQDALKSAEDDLANHTIKAPFAGVVGKVDLEVGDKVSNNSPVATLITNQKVAEVSLNEVDISKVKIGQKATLTFDAIDNLTITGTVTEVDLLGTVSQGVVNYTVKIAFDVNDDRVKTGMSLSAAIIYDSKEDVLMVPNSAVKSAGGTSYVDVLDKTIMDGPNANQGITSNVPPTQINIETGISNDEFTEVLSGLNEGDKFVSRTITQSTTQTTTQAPSLIGGNRGVTGGNVRFQTR